MSIRSIVIRSFALVALLLALGTGMLFVSAISGDVPVSAQLSLVEEMTPAEVYQQASQSVVAISVTIAATPTTQSEIPSSPLQMPEVNPNSFSEGSGFVLDIQGHIITNAHVVDGATRIEVEFFDGTLTRAEIVGLDRDSDVAVIKVNLPAEQLVPLVLADSDALEIGQSVLAIGSPFGERWTLTQGIISALDRSIRGLNEYSIGGAIQTDAAINPGNSGGPLLNLRGEVIGVNSQIESRTGSFAGIGFAIPSNLVQNVARQLIEQGYVQYSYLGIQGGDVSLRMIEALNLPANLRGVVVSQALGGGPAARAGLQNAGDLVEVDGLRVPRQVDVITAINGQPLRGIADLIAYLAKNTRPGDDVTLTVLRNGSETLTLTVRLTPRPA